MESFAGTSGGEVQGTALCENPPLIPPVGPGPTPDRGALVMLPAKRPL